MSGKYFLEIRDEDNARELLAFAYGDAAEINFIGRREIGKLVEKSAAGAKGDHSFRLLEVKYIGQDIESDETVRLANIIADADTIAGALKRKLSLLKKSE
jgi:hypothetical protein